MEWPSNLDHLVSYRRLHLPFSTKSPQPQQNSYFIPEIRNALYAVLCYVYPQPHTRMFGVYLPASNNNATPVLHSPNVKNQPKERKRAMRWRLYWYHYLQFSFACIATNTRSTPDTQAIQVIQLVYHE